MSKCTCDQTEKPLPGRYVAVQKPDGTIVKMWHIDEKALAQACGVGCKQTYVMPPSSHATEDGKVVDFLEARRLLTGKK